MFICILLEVLSIDIRADSIIDALTDSVINVLTVVFVGAGVDISADADITVVDTMVVGLGFATLASCKKDVMFGVLIDALTVVLFIIIIVGATGIDVELSADMRFVKVLAAVVTGSEFAVAVPLEESTMRSW